MSNHIELDLDNDHIDDEDIIYLIDHIKDLNKILREYLADRRLEGDAPDKIALRLEAITSYWVKG